MMRALHNLVVAITAAKWWLNIAQLSHELLFIENRTAETYTLAVCRLEHKRKSQGCDQCLALSEHCVAIPSHLRNHGVILDQL